MAATSTQCQRVRLLDNWESSIHGANKGELGIVIGEERVLPESETWPVAGQRRIFAALRK